MSTADAGVRALTFREWLAKNESPCAYRWVTTHLNDAQRYGDYCREQAYEKAAQVLRDLVERERNKVPDDRVELRDIEQEWLAKLRELAKTPNDRYRAARYK